MRRAPVFPSVRNLPDPDPTVRCSYDAMITGSLGSYSCRSSTPPPRFGGHRTWFRCPGDIVNSEESIVLLPEPNVRTIELLLDEAVPVEAVRGLEGEERRHPHNDGAQDFVADVEVVVGEAALLAGQDAVVRIFGRELRHGDPERPSLFHALENEVHAESVLAHHFAQPWLHIVFLAHAPLGPLNGDTVIAGKGLDPALIIGGPLA
jgi:hypothetical protein